MKMKRPITLTGSILGLCGSVAAGVVAVLSLIVMIDAVSSYGVPAGSITLLIIMGLIATIYVISIALMIVSIAAWHKDKAGYKKKKGATITAVVFAFIGAILAILTGDLILIISGIVCVASAILLIVDLARENGKWKKLEGAKPQVAPEQPQANTAKPAAQPQTNPVEQPPISAPVVSDKVKAAEEFAQRMTKITALKNQGILTEQEYSDIKKHFIIEYIKQ